MPPLCLVTLHKLWPQLIQRRSGKDLRVALSAPSASSLRGAAGASRSRAPMTPAWVLMSRDALVPTRDRKLRVHTPIGRAARGEQPGNPAQATVRARAVSEAHAEERAQTSAAAQCPAALPSSLGSPAQGPILSQTLALSRRQTPLLRPARTFLPLLLPMASGVYGQSERTCEWFKQTASFRLV